MIRTLLQAMQGSLAYKMPNFVEQSFQTFALDLLLATSDSQKTPKHFAQKHNGGATDQPDQQTAESETVLCGPPFFPLPPPPANRRISASKKHQKCKASERVSNLHCHLCTSQHVVFHWHLYPIEQLHAITNVYLCCGYSSIYSERIQEFRS